jgi:hypothetical protein
MVATFDAEIAVPDEFLVELNPSLKESPLIPPTSV